jgi:hypothetical protein
MLWHSIKTRLISHCSTYKQWRKEKKGSAFSLNDFLLPQLETGGQLAQFVVHDEAWKLIFWRGAEGRKPLKGQARPPMDSAESMKRAMSSTTCGKNRRRSNVLMPSQLEFPLRNLSHLTSFELLIIYTLGTSKYVRLHRIITPWLAPVCAVCWILLFIFVFVASRIVCTVCAFSLRARHCVACAFWILVYSPNTLILSVYRVHPREWVEKTSWRSQEDG